MDRYPFPPYPNGWFRVAYSNEIAAGEVKRLHLFGRELVLFRTEEGSAHVLDAHCPHLGAHMGVGGRVEGNCIRCPFHAWLWDGEGRCKEVPYAQRIPPRVRANAWRVQEKNGLVFVFHHMQGEEPTYELPEVPQIGGEGWCEPHIEHWKVRARWLDMNENCVDQAHFKYIHGTLSIPETKAEADGPVFTATSRPKMRSPAGEGEGLLITKDYGPAFQVVTIEGIIDTVLMNSATPIDEETTDVSFAYTVRTEGDPRKEKLAKAVIADLVSQFDHDLPIWENKAYWTTPRLCDGDGPFASYRKWIQQFF